MAATTWNPADKTAIISLSGGDLVAMPGVASTFCGVRAINPISSGKAYFEVTNTITSITDIFVGVATAAKDLASSNSTNAAWVDIFGGGIGVHGSSVGTLSAVFASGDVACVALDMTNKRFWIRQNGGNWNGSGAANPATNTGGLDVSVLFASASAYPIALFSNNTVSEKINAGASAFAQAMPAGFATWNSFFADPVAPAGGNYAGSVASASRGRMIRKRKKDDTDDLDPDDLEVANPSQIIRIGRQTY